MGEIRRMRTPKSKFTQFARIPNVNSQIGARRLLCMSAICAKSHSIHKYLGYSSGSDGAATVRLTLFCVCLCVLGYARSWQLYPLFRTRTIVGMRACEYNFIRNQKVSFISGDKIFSRIPSR